MLLIPLLRSQLKKLNPTSITNDERAVFVITRLRMLRDNQEWVSLLRGEQTMSFAVGENAQNIRLIDFEDPDANDYLCTNQAWIQGVERRRPDILLFLLRPRLPPVVIDWAEGAKQCGRYDREIGQLYASNCFCVGVNELRMKYGVPGVPLQYWQQWRDPAPHTHIPSFDEMKCTVYGRSTVGIYSTSSKTSSSSRPNRGNS
jgi:type I restriction enzyme R subunit